MIVKFILLWVVITGLVFVVRYVLTKADRRKATSWGKRLLIAAAIAFGIMGPLWFLNNLSGI